MPRNHGARRARDGVEDVRELEGGQEEAPTLRLALARLARNELFERDRLARDPLTQLRHLRHELQPFLGAVRFFRVAAWLDEKRGDAVGVYRL
jgi:hypothetical protein